MQTQRIACNFGVPTPWMDGLTYLEGFRMSGLKAAKYRISR